MKRSTIYWFLHNFLAHGILMAFTGENAFSLRVHDWTADRAQEAERQEALHRMKVLRKVIAERRPYWAEFLTGRR